MNSIYETTKRNCILYQRESQLHAQNAQYLVQRNKVRHAIDRQRKAAEAHEYMRVRLERLIGV